VTKNVKWSRFIDVDHIVAVEELKQSERFIQPLRISIISIVEEKVIASLNLPDVPHVSYFSYHRESSHFCFAEECNAHVYRITPDKIFEVCNA
jgi:hypothetical protein